MDTGLKSVYYSMDQEQKPRGTLQHVPVIVKQLCILFMFVYASFTFFEFQLEKQK